MMWVSVLFLGLSFGALSAIPTGPVGVLIVRNTLRARPRAALASTVGLAGAEFLYVVMLIIGLKGWIFSRPLLWHGVASVGASIVLALGIKTLLSAKKSLEHLSRDNNEHGPHDVSFGRHIAIAFTITIANPAILFVLSSAVSFYASAFARLPDAFALSVYLLAVQAGVVGWFLVLIVMLSRLAGKSAVRARLQRHLERVSGWVLTAFGLYLLGREAAALWEALA